MKCRAEPAERLGVGKSCSLPFFFSFTFILWNYALSTKLGKEVNSNKRGLECTCFLCQVLGKKIFPALRVWQQSIGWWCHPHVQSFCLFHLHYIWRSSRPESLAVSTLRHIFPCLVSNSGLTRLLSWSAQKAKYKSIASLWHVLVIPPAPSLLPIMPPKIWSSRDY